MKAGQPQHRGIFLTLAFAGIMAVGLLAGNGISKDITSYGGTKLGTVPEFHPELGMGWLQGYLDPKALPNSLALIPRPPEPGSTAQLLDEEVARDTFGVARRGSPWRKKTSI